MNNEVKAIHTVRKDKAGNPLETTFSRRVWISINKMQKGNYDAQGHWREKPDTVETPPEAKAPTAKKIGRPKKS